MIRTCGLTLTLGGGTGGTGTAGAAEASGFAGCLGRAWSAQVIVGSCLSLLNSWSGTIQAWAAALWVSGPSLSGVGFDVVGLYGSRSHLSKGLEMGVWSVDQNFLRGSVSCLSRSFLKQCVPRAVWSNKKRTRCIY